MLHYKDLNWIIPIFKKESRVSKQQTDNNTATTKKHHITVSIMAECIFPLQQSPRRPDQTQHQQMLAHEINFKQPADSKKNIRNRLGRFSENPPKPE